jgi:hypothetical protein
VTREMTMPALRRDEDGIAIPTALLAMMILLMLGGLFVTYGTSEQRATRGTQAFEGGLHVAETAVEIGLASLSDPDQADRPYEPTSPAPAGEAAARQWAIDRAIERVTPDCGDFKRTAGGDGIAILDDSSGMVYGVGFLPDCTSRRSVRVVRLAFDEYPVSTYSPGGTILTNGDIVFNGNASVAGGLHANGNVTGGPHQAPGGGITAAGTCTDSTHCTPGAPALNVPAWSARHFWDTRLESQVNVNGDPIYELCSDGQVRINSTNGPCTNGTIIPPPHAGWRFQTSHTYGSTQVTNRNWGATWVWDRNHGPPDGIYYAHHTNVVSNDNSGMSTSSRFTVIAEADRTKLASNGAHSGSIGFTQNPKFFASWTGVGVVADVDIVIDKNLSAFGSATMVFAREQFMFVQNGRSDRTFYIACDESLANTTYDPETNEPYCDRGTSLKSSVNSPISSVRIRQNTTFDAPGEGVVVTPNLGITGVTAWEVL